MNVLPIVTGNKITGPTIWPKNKNEEKLVYIVYFVESLSFHHHRNAKSAAARAPMAEVAAAEDEPPPDEPVHVPAAHVIFIHPPAPSSLHSPLVSVDVTD